MKEFLGRASRTSYWIGAVLCLTHLVISWSVIINLALEEPDAQWQLIWLFFMPFDLPFSILDFSGILLPNWSFDTLPYPISEFRGYILPSFVHGVIGPIWYFLLPIIISSIWKRHQEKKRKAVVSYSWF